MAPLTKGMLASLGKAIDQIPEHTDAFRNQSKRFYKARRKERSLFRKLVAKLGGTDKEEQIAFLIDQARKISSTTYIKAALKSISPPPDYGTLPKTQRQNYAHLHQLVDQILPIAAGSESTLSQKMLFESRWSFVHKEPYVPTNISIKSLCKALESKFDNKNDLIELYMTRAKTVSKSFLDIALKMVSLPPDYTSLDKKERRKYNYLHTLVDKVLPVAAGSKYPTVQLKLLERR